VSYKIELKGTPFVHNINAGNFDDIALQVFAHQYRQNDIYRAFTDALRIAPAEVTNVEQIPFLPISFFKTHKVVSDPHAEIAFTFESSGTTGETPSRHYVTDAAVYRESLLRGFQQFYSDPKDYAILALLPSYLERKNASLVHMAKVLIEESGHPDCGFYLDEWNKLAEVISKLEARGQKALLLGVTFALLDFAEAHPMQLEHTIVMETGGMKGRREEWTRRQVHEFLEEKWQLDKVHSEYGMTELLSQAYSQGDGLFLPTDTMKVLIRDINDPLEVRKTGSGCLNIIDLANLNSCSFIATEDIGNMHADGHFEVLGRLDHAALRGCSLMVVS
jgi:phenylacetate-coenzyme A ligase PaaK-like adenylate-forming protein